MNYFVYKLTNTKNNKYYIGVHKTDDPNDSYLGSGTALAAAKKKYGEAAFVKTILFETPEHDTAYEKETEILGDSWKTDPACYNAMPGGVGGWEHVDTSGGKNAMKDPEVVKRVVESKKANGSYHTEAALEAVRANAKLGAMGRKGTKDNEDTKARRNESVRKAHARPETRKRYLAAMERKRARFKLLSPEGKEHITENVGEWCKEHGAALSTVTTKNDGELVKRGPLKGWRIWRLKN